MAELFLGVNGDGGDCSGVFVMVKAVREETMKKVQNECKESETRNDVKIDIGQRKRIGIRY